MNTAFLIYLVMELDRILGMLIVLAMLAGIMLITPIVFAWCEGEDVKRLGDMMLERKKLTIVFALLVFMATVMPNTKTAIYMIGGSATIDALQSEKAKEIGGKALEVLQKKLDEELEK